MTHFPTLRSLLFHRVSNGKWTIRRKLMFRYLILSTGIPTILSLLFSIDQVFALPNETCVHTDHRFRCVVFVRNYDGDTVTFNIPGVHPLIGKEINIRLNGVDTPEIRGKLPCEKERALLAKDFVFAELSAAESIELVDVSRGKFFRIVADIVYDSKNLKDELLRRNLGRPYDGGRKSPTGWCP